MHGLGPNLWQAPGLHLAPAGDSYPAGAPMFSLIGRYEDRRPAPKVSQLMVEALF